jgi:metal-sulfur cluster biosynthetic enzyme
MVTSEIVVSELKQIFDPEIPVNIHDLGLIYGIEIDEAVCTIQMTLTSQSCPMAQQIGDVVKTRVGALEGVEECRIDLVWEPMWTPHKISPEGRRILGMEDLPPEPEPTA